MKTKEELNALREEVEALNDKLTELSEEELKQVTGGFKGKFKYVLGTWDALSGADELKGKIIAREGRNVGAEEFR